MWAFGAIRSAWVVLAYPAAVLTGLAFAAPIAAWAVTVKMETSFNYVFRFGMMPLMLFSGTFFPLSQLPAGLRALAYATPLWHGVALCRAFSLGTAASDPARDARPRCLPGRAGRRGDLGRGPHLPQAPVCLSEHSCLASPCGCSRRPGCWPGSSGRVPTRAACA